MEFLYKWINGVSTPIAREHSMDLFLMVLIVSAIMSAIYYLAINNGQTGFHRTKHWTMFMTLNGLIIAALTWTLVMGSRLEVVTNIYLAVLNLGLSCLIFYLLSFIFKRGSKLARKVPH